jgi:4-hydroxybenzoate polyprenyltransferase
VKQHRPIAASQISVQAGFTAYFSLLVVSTAIPLLLINPAVTLIILGYHVLNVLYSWKLKHIVIVDLLVIAADFILRVIAGGLAIGAPISNWLLMCVLLLALFLAVAKRREELIRTNISNENDSTRKVLDDYSERLLDQMLAIVAGLTIISYSLYTILNENFNHLLYTVPFVLYGIFRYLYIIYQKAGGANPEKEMLHDKHILFTIFLWIVTVLVIIVFCQ